MKPFLLNDKIAVITGGAGGIGRATAVRMAQAGAVPVIFDSDAEQAARTGAVLRRLNPRAMALACDVRRQADCQQAIDRVIDTLGGIDVLFNNAGITQRSAFADTGTAVFETVMAVNFFGALYCTKAALDSLIARQGAIVVNESIAGIAPLLGRTGYSASKHALHGLFTSLRCELRPQGVHVMIVCPGFVRTGLQARALDGDGTVTAHPQSTLGRSATPEQVADAIVAGLRRRRTMLVLTPVGKLGHWIHRLAPELYERLMSRQLRSELQGR